MITDTTIQSTEFFVVGGTMKPNSVSYIPRAADEKLFRSALNGKFCYVLTARQTGKSSLMVRMAHRLKENGICVAIIDLSANDTKGIKNDQWYMSLLFDLKKGIGLSIDVESWWHKNEVLGPLKRFNNFLYEVILQEIKQPVVIFVDEIDTISSLDFSDDFFAAIRSIYNARATDSAYNHLTFVLLGVATPDELVKDVTRTPFNIGEAIELKDFDKEECDVFRQQIETAYPAIGSIYFDEIYEWTRGHPYLTQKLCALLLTEKTLTEGTSDSNLVDNLVKKHFLTVKDQGDTNIQFVQDRVTKDPNARELLRLYKQVLDGTPIPDNQQSPVINKLKLYGLVNAQRGQLKVRNKLYVQAFDDEWVNKMLRISMGVPGNYKILQEIGRGGMATVFLAEDKNQTQVALKVLRPQEGVKAQIVRGLKQSGLDATEPQLTELVRAQIIKRIKEFEKEARLITKLQHNNIVRIFETGSFVIENGQEEALFIAMEYIPGDTLRDKLVKGQLRRDETIQIIQQVGQALAHAHTHEIIHRDVKPENILLDTRQDSIRPVLTDFGLGMTLSTADNNTQIITDTIKGTPAYIAPEQLDQKIPSPATDVYALAIVVYEMLSGEQPFKGGMFQIIKNQFNDPLPLLSAVTSNKIYSFFDDVLQKATAKEPSHRFQTMLEFIEALETAYQQVQEAEDSIKQKDADNIIFGVQSYLKKERYDWERALSMIDAALEISPNYAKALRLKGKIWLSRRRFEDALQVYEQAYEQIADKPYSAEGVDYFGALQIVAEYYWEGGQCPEAIKYYEKIKHLLSRDYPPGHIYVDQMQQIWQKTRERLIDYYHQQAEEVYAEAKFENIDEVITNLEVWQRKLIEVEAVDEAAQLKSHQRDLEIKIYEEQIKAQKAIFKKSKTGSETTIRQNEIAVYEEIHNLYVKLVNLDATKQGELRENLKTLIQLHQFLANRLRNKRPEPDYRQVIGHYETIRQFEREGYGDVIQELNIDFAREIAQLTNKANAAEQYAQIETMVARKEFAEAIKELEEKFVRPGFYYGQSLSLLEAVLYAKEHNEMPPTWGRTSEIDRLNKELLETNQEQLEKLKQKLQIWFNLAEEIKNKKEALSLYRIEFGNIEKMGDVISQPDLLQQFRAKIEKQEQALEIDVTQVEQDLVDWRQKIEDFETGLAVANPQKDIAGFLNETKEMLNSIRRHKSFNRLQDIQVDDEKIRQDLAMLKADMFPKLVTDLQEKEAPWRQKTASLTQQRYIIISLCGLMMIIAAVLWELLIRNLL